MDYSLLVGIQSPKGSDLTKSVDDIKPKTMKKIRSHVYFCEDIKTIKTRSATLRPSRSRSQAMIDRRNTESERKEFVFFLKTSNPPSSLTTTGFHSYEGNEFYFIGIIDILQKYNNKKRIANLAKSLRHAKDELSTVEPKMYAAR